MWLPRLILKRDNGSHVDCDGKEGHNAVNDHSAGGNLYMGHHWSSPFTCDPCLFEVLQFPEKQRKEHRVQVSRCWGLQLDTFMWLPWMQVASFCGFSLTWIFHTFNKANGKKVPYFTVNPDMQSFTFYYSQRQKEVFKKKEVGRSGFLNWFNLGWWLTWSMWGRKESLLNLGSTFSIAWELWVVTLGDGREGTSWLSEWTGFVSFKICPTVLGRGSGMIHSKCSRKGLSWTLLGGQDEVKKEFQASTPS